VDETYVRVAAVLGEALAVEPEGVTPRSNVLTDLGADSLDMMDILYRLEQEFGVELEREELFPAFLFRDGTEHVADGRLTETGRLRVLDHFPFLPAHEIAEGDDPKGLLTAGLLAGFIEARLDGARLRLA
jgi:acyl carrier protein